MFSFASRGGRLRSLLPALLAAGLLSVLWPETAAADFVPDDTLDTGDTAWMLTSSALVLMMTAPGLALFYGGLVRKKNILSVMMQCIFLCGLMSVIWAVYGYSLAFAGNMFGEGDGGIIGGFDYVCLQGVAPESIEGSGDVTLPMAGTIPHLLFMTFQGMFFIITPALICGAFAERMKFSAMCLFMVLWGTFVYCPIAHWVWASGGWLLEGRFEAYDFAGGTVVHVSSGVAALVAAMMVGPRIGHRTEPMPPHNLTYTMIGASLLWVGWFGFNAGSALAANGSAVNAFAATHLAAAGGVISWALAERFISGRATVLGACSGAIAGLVCITPAAGVVTPMQGVILGLVAGIVCYLACTTVKSKLGYDDSLDAFGVHGVGGALGAVLTGVFASPDIVGETGGVGLLFSGELGQVINQIVGVAAAAGLSAVGSVVFLLLIKVTIGLRVDADDERRGLDTTEHGEEGYIFI